MGDKKISKLQAASSVEQKKAEAILEGIAESLIVVDKEGRIISVNKMAENLLGRSRSELIGQKIETVLITDIDNGNKPPVIVTLETGKPCLDMTYNIKTNSSLIPVIASATPLLDDAGTLIGSIESIRDISKLRKLEREKDEFVSMLAHDLKGPVTSIVGSLDIIFEGRLGAVNAEQKEFINIAIDSCEELVRMINSLVDTHKFESSSIPVNFTIEDPTPVLNSLLLTFSGAAIRDDIKLSVKIEKELKPLKLDAVIFNRVLENLITNSLNFTREGGSITIKADEVGFSKVRSSIPHQLYPAHLLPSNGQYLRVVLEDTGSGIPKDAIYTIFDRFKQADSRKQGKVKGSGLGLAFCREAMNLHNGFIWADSAEGKWSRFTLLFPMQH